MSLLLRPRLILATVACFLFADAWRAAIKPIIDPDVWWVAAAGRLMRLTGEVPRANTFAISDALHPWVMHEWLFAIPYDLGLERWGPPFFALVGLCSMTAISSLVLLATIGRSRSFAAGALLALVAVALLNHRSLSPRAANVALLFPLAMASIAFAKRGAWWRAAAAIGLQIVWTNAHGSFPLGVALLGAAALEHREDRPLRLWTTAGAALATLLNPYGLQLHALFLRYLVGADGVFRLIAAQNVEFQPLWAAPRYLHTTIPFGALLVGTLAVFALRSPRWRVRGTLVLILIAAGVLHVRHLELAGLLGIVLLAPAWDELFPEASPARARLWIPLIVASLAVGLVAHRAESKQDPAYWYGPDAPLVQLAPQVPAGARLFVPFRSSGLALWLTAPRDVHLLFDPRNDCYSLPVAEDALALDDPSPQAAAATAILDRYRIDAVLAPSDHPLADVLQDSPDWYPRATDDDWTLWGR